MKRSGAGAGTGARVGGCRATGRVEWRKEVKQWGGAEGEVVRGRGRCVVDVRQAVSAEEGEVMRGRGRCGGQVAESAGKGGSCGREVCVAQRGEVVDGRG